MKFELSISGAVAADATQATDRTDLPKQVNGKQAFYYWRKCACNGSFVHPTYNWTLNIDAKRRAMWVEKFRMLQAADVAIPVVEDHDVCAAKTLGYVVDMRNDGEWLYQLHQYIGEEERDIALKNMISIGIDPNFKDGQGNQYGEAIDHTAVTPIPVIAGTGDATRIAASLAARSNRTELVLDPKTSIAARAARASGTDDDEAELSRDLSTGDRRSILSRAARASDGPSSDVKDRAARAWRESSFERNQFSNTRSAFMAKKPNGVQQLIDYLRGTGTGENKLQIAAEQMAAGDHLKPEQAIRVAIDHMKVRGVSEATLGKAEVFLADYPDGVKPPVMGLIGSATGQFEHKKQG